MVKNKGIICGLLYIFKVKDQKFGLIVLLIKVSSNEDFGGVWWWSDWQ